MNEGETRTSSASVSLVFFFFRLTTEQPATIFNRIVPGLGLVVQSPIKLILD